MASSRIKQLEDLLQERIGTGKKIINVEETEFLQKGENYGSSLFRVDITVEDLNTGEQEVIYTVAKTLPSSEEQKQIFNIQHTVPKEIAFYNIIVSKLREFVKESGVHIDFDFFPILHGGRLNLDGGSKVDEDSVILLENLIAGGFKNVDRFEGFDYETSKIVIRDIAAFHAVPLAMRLKKPDEFEKYVKSYCSDSFHRPDGEAPPPPPPEGGFGDILLEILYQNDKCLKPAMAIAEKFKNIAKMIEKGTPPDIFRASPEGPWHSIAHNDLWVNNLMVKFNNGKPVATRLVDFQNYNYETGLNDIFFFMWTSIQHSVLDQSFDELLQLYHKHFFDILSKLGCDTQPYTLQLMLEEIDKIAKNEVMHVLFFIMIVFGKKGGNPDSILPNFKEFLVEASLPCKEKIWFMAQEWSRRNWL